MMEDKFALLRAHRNNIDRYRRLLRTQLTELERGFIQKRLSEEQAAMDELAALTFPVSFRDPMPAIARTAASNVRAGHV